MGEGGTIGAPAAIANTLADALGVYGGMNENFVLVAGWSRWEADGV
jgi:hypothetical protein